MADQNVDTEAQALNVLDVKGQFTDKLINPTTAPDPDEATKRQENVNKWREAADKGSKTAAEMMAGKEDLPKVDEIRKMVAGALLDIDPRDRAAYARLDPADKQRYEEALGIAIGAKLLSEGKGTFTGLIGERESLRYMADIKKSITDLVTLTPEGKHFFDILSPVEKENLIDALSKDPKVIEQIKAKFEEATEEGKMPGKADAKLTREKTDAENELTRQKTRLANLQRENDRSDDVWKKLNDPTDTSLGGKFIADVERGAYGDLQAQLREADYKLGQAQAKVNEVDAKIDAINKDPHKSLADRKTEIDDIRRNELPKLIKERDDRQVEKKLVQDHADQYTRLITARDAAFDKVGKFKNDIDEQKTKVKEAQDTFDKVEDKLKGSETNIKADREKFAKEMKGVIKEGVRAYLADEYNKAATRQKEDLEKAKAESRTKAQDLVIKKVEDSYMQKKTRTKFGWAGKQIVDWEVNKRELGRHSEMLLRTNDPKELVRDVLQKAGYGGTDLDEIMKEPWVTQRGQDLAAKVIEKRIATGKLTHGEVTRIAGTKWGEGLVTRSYESNERIQAEIRNLQDMGVLHGDFAEWISKHPKESIGFSGAIMAMLAGAALAGIAPTAVGAAATAARAGGRLWFGAAA